MGVCILNLLSESIAGQTSPEISPLMLTVGVLGRAVAAFEKFCVGASVVSFLMLIAATLMLIIE